jgi:hypothetical protein
MANVVIDFLPELKKFVKAQVKLVKISSARYREQRLRSAKCPDVPKFKRWGETLNFIGDLVGKWDAAKQVWGREKLTSSDIKMVKAGFENGSIELSGWSQGTPGHSTLEAGIKFPGSSSLFSGFSGIPDSWLL